MKEQTVKFSEIDHDSPMLTRSTEAYKISRITELIALGEYPPSMTVCRAGKRYLLLDGNNRYEAWKRAFNGFDGEVQVIVVNPKNEQERIAAAIEPNITQGSNYRPEQIGPLYMRLLKEFGFSKAKARKLLRLSEEHAERFEVIRMEATSAVSAESPVAQERAAAYESTDRGERAIGPELPARLERAKKAESSVIEERAALSEPSISWERARKAESSESAERARAEESPTTRERVEDDESPVQTERVESTESPNRPERADHNAIHFHVEALLRLTPSTWTEGTSVLKIYAEIVEAKRKESEK